PFLLIQVFGQTPIYISSTGWWDLWPEIPAPPALLAWLEKHRLPHFCKSSLCLHLVLCQKLLGFIRLGEAAKLLNWQSADQWLLEKCISGSQGMWHFWVFVQGKAHGHGEELTNFWLTTKRDLYLSLLHKLKATHLCEGSSVITLCRTILGKKHGNPKQDEERALYMIQSYWLPKFFIHCKMGMEEEKLCQPLLQEYQEQLLQANSREPSDFSENLFKIHIKRSQGLSGPYCSKKAKVEIWTLVKEGRDTEEIKMSRFQVQPEREPGPTRSTKESHLDKNALGSIPQQSEHPANAAFGGKGGATSPKRPRPNAEQVLHLEDTCAAQPFRDFLKHQDRSVDTHLLDLWHDLEEFLPVVLDHSRENSFFLHHVIGEQICKTLLDEGTIQQLPLETRTLRSLWNHLTSGEFSTWIFRIFRCLPCWISKGRGPGYFPGHWWHRDHISWCLLLYRHFIKLLHNPAHLQFFKQFLEEHNAAEPLCFWMAVEKLVTETNPRTKKFLINCIVRKYFHTQIPAGRYPPTLQFTPFMIKASFQSRALVSEQDLACLCRFSRLADSVEALATRNRQSEKEVDFLKRKAAIISKLFLNSDIPPKLWYLFLEIAEMQGGVREGNMPLGPIRSTTNCVG
uniref:RGS domain-containing protein n=1 Tax=Otus sunia TaxID=257818 RepID=A0A8C8BME4_9STRI